MTSPRLALACDACSWIPPSTTLGELYEHGVEHHGLDGDASLALRSYIRFFCPAHLEDVELDLVRNDPRAQTFSCKECKHVYEVDHQALLASVGAEIAARLRRDPSGSAPQSAMISA